MKHRTTLLALVPLAAAALLAGCNNDKPATTKPPSQTMSSPSPSAPAIPSAYAMPADLCTAVNAEAFTDVLPAGPVKTKEMGRSQTQRITTATCVVTLGNLDQTVLISVGVDVFSNAYGAQGQYEGLRGVAFKDNPAAHDINGVGSAAYFVADSDLGPRLVLYAANAHIGVSAVAVDDDKPLPADIERRLISTANTTLAKLPTA